MKPADAECLARAATAAASKDQDQRAARAPVIALLSYAPRAALITLGPGAEIPEEVHEVDELLLLVSGRVVVRTPEEARLDDSERFALRGLRIGRGVAHSLRAGADGAVLVTVMLPAVAAAEGVAHPDGDPFAAAPWSKARYGFVSALDALAKVTVRRYPGGGERPDEERRRDELAIVDACAAVCRAAGYAVGTEHFRDQRRADTSPGRSWVKRAEARLVALEQAPTLARLAAVEAEVLAMRGRLDALEAREARLDPELLGLRGRLDALEREASALPQRVTELHSFTVEWVSRLTSRVSEIERRLAPKPDALSEECQRIAAEMGAPPPAAPRAGEVWEDSKDGERVRLREPTQRLVAPGTIVPAWLVDVVANPAPTWTGGICTREVSPPRWRRVPSEQDARAALREEVAALCDAAGWPCAARDVRDGGEDIKWILGHYPSKRPAEQAALAGLERLVAQDAADRGTLPRMPEQTGIATPPVPHITAEQERAAVLAYLRRHGNAHLALAAAAIERGDHHRADPDPGF